MLPNIPAILLKCHYETGLCSTISESKEAMNTFSILFFIILFSKQRIILKNIKEDYFHFVLLFFWVHVLFVFGSEK